MYRNFHNSTNYDSKKMGGGEQPNYPLTEEWISKLWCSHKVEYYTWMKMNYTININLGQSHK